MQAKFASLPIDIKEKFGNDPTVFMAEILSGEGLQKLKKEPETAVQEENKDEQKQ